MADNKTLITTSSPSVPPSGSLVPTLEELCLRYRLFSSLDITSEHRQLLLDVLLGQTNQQTSNTPKLLQIYTSIRPAESYSQFVIAVPARVFPIHRGPRTYVDHNRFQGRVYKDLMAFTLAYPCKRYCLIAWGDYETPLLFPPFISLTSTVDTDTKEAPGYRTFGNKIHLVAFKCKTTKQPELITYIQLWKGEESLLKITELIATHLKRMLRVGVALDRTNDPLDEWHPVTHIEYMRC